MEYPGGETINYSYDKGGQLLKVGNSSYNYLDRMAYDHYGSPVFKKYGNNTKTRYTYEPQLRRLQNLNVKSTDNSDMLANTYTFDFVGNITSIHNTAAPVNQLGGVYNHTYTYDDLNRLEIADGNWNNSGATYSLNMTYDNMHRITDKNQNHQQNGTNVSTNTYSNNYDFGDQSQPRPHAVKEIRNSGIITDQFTYDNNGNTLTHTRPTGPDPSKQFLWDEVNRLRFLYMQNTSIDHYIYDASGERAFKASMPVAAVSQNGGTTQYQATFSGYTSYVSGYMVVNPYGKVSKHYYVGSERIASRLEGDVSGFMVEDLPETQETTLLHQRLQREHQEVILGQWGIGLINQAPPTIQYAQTCRDLVNLGLMEEAKQCYCNLNGSCQDLLYYYHPDHVGSSTFLSDINGQPYQFLLYLPFGETMIEQTTASWTTPYMFNGKELDESTGLYYYGARYYDPRVSMWHGVDPLAEMYPSWSPYNYTLNNPVRFTDPTGMSVEGDYYNKKGQHIGNDGKADNKIYLVNDGVSAQDLGLNIGFITGSLYQGVRDANTTEVGGLMILTRTSEGTDNTTGEMTMIGRNGTDNVYTLEPGGPATTKANQNKRVPDGVYDVDNYSSKKYPDNFIISNEDVSKSRKILLHSGNSPRNTQGCILPGCKTGTGSVSASKEAMNSVRNFIRNNDRSVIDKKDDVKLIIRTEIKN